MANIVFAAIIVGMVVGLGLRDAPAGPTPPPSVEEPARAALQAQRQAADAPSLEAVEPRETVVEGEPFDLALQSPSGQRGGSSARFLATQGGDPFSFADVVEAVSPAVVTVSNVRGAGADDLGGLFDRFFRGRRGERMIRGHGSGFIIEPDGLILTNNHVVDSADQLIVRLGDGREFDAEVVRRDEQTDIALLRIDAANLPTARLGDSDAMRVGDWVLAIGSPFRQQLEHSVSAGIISGKSRGDIGIAGYEDFLQTDAAVNPGNSGGPLVNLRGEVVGMNTAIATQNGQYQGVSFAIPINFASDIVQRLLRDGRVTRAWLGVTIRNVVPEVAEANGLDRPEGVQIQEVLEDGPAERAGLRRGDVIVAMDGAPTARVSSFRNRVSLSEPGQHVEFDVLRDGAPRTVTAELGELTPEMLAELRNAPRPLPGDRTPGELGFALSDLTPRLRARYDVDDRTEGVLVAHIDPGSAAENAGLEPGDVIGSVNRRRVRSVDEFEEAVERMPDDRALALRVKRGPRSILVTLRRPS
jgi:serine protease Do